METATESDLTKIRRVSHWLRGKMLRWWKRKVTTSYIDWAKEKYALLDVKENVDWIKWNGVKYVWSCAGKGDY
jgi:hypothetical protein